MLKIGAVSFSKIVGGPFIVHTKISNLQIQNNAILLCKIFGILLMLDCIVLYIATVHNSVEFVKIHGANQC